MALIVVRAVRIHVETRALGDDRVAPFDIADAFARQAYGDDGPEAQRLFHQCCDVGHFLFDKAALPGVVVGVDSVDLGEGLGLDVFPAG